MHCFVQSGRHTARFEGRPDRRPRPATWAAAPAGLGAAALGAVPNIWRDRSGDAEASWKVSISIGRRPIGSRLCTSLSPGQYTQGALMNDPPVVACLRYAQ